MQMVSIKLGASFLTLCLSAVIFTTTVTCETMEYKIKLDKDINGKRDLLSKSAVPLHYDIGIVTLLANKYMLYCKCQINITVIKKTSAINLHTPYLNETNSNITLVTPDGDVFKSKYVNYIVDREMSFIYFETLSPGSYILSISYLYTLPHGEEKGLFRNTMVFGKKENVSNSFSLLTTNVQSTEARKWLPCWDEPSYRTTFDIRLLHDGTFTFWPTLKDTTRVIEHGEKMRWKWTNFSISEAIPASNVMFALTNLQHAPYMVDYSINIRHSMAEYIKFANTVINKIKQSTWFKKIPASRTEIQQIATPLIQQDTIGKWKLIIYKELLVTYDETTDCSSKKLEIARTITYAMVNQLIDNAIRLSWWTDMWLQKGVVMLLQAEILNEIFPKWRFMELFIVQMQLESLRLEQYSIMRPLEYEVNSASDIKSLFSFSINIKAPIILRMIQHTMNYNIEQALNLCFLRKPFSNTNNSWAPEETYSRKEMCSARYNMLPWIKSSNYPVVRITRENDSLLLQITTYSYPSDIDILKVWMVPITWTLHIMNVTETRRIEWVHDSTRISIVDTDWVIVNKKKAGYYRVLYDKKSLRLIAKCLQSPNYKKIDVVNRAQIIDDTYHFWKYLQYNYVEFKEVTKYLTQEMDYVAWYSMFQIFRDMSDLCPYPESEPLQNDMRFLLTSLLDKLTYEEKSGEDDLVKWLRQEAARWACTFGSLECQKEASRLLKKHINSKSMLSPDWKEWTYCQGAIRAEQSVLEKLQLLLDTHERKHFNYYRCLQKPPSLHTYLLESFKKGRKIPIYLYYNILIEYAVRHIDEIWITFESQNILGEVQSKLLYIIINRLYSRHILAQLKSEISFHDTSELGQYLDALIHNRQEKIIMKERVFTYIFKFKR